jgi:prepilin-type N-terminal cleavage/methylation domain-containing protein
MLRIKQINSSEKGFSLLELIIVLSVLTMLSTIGIASFSSGSKTASVETAANDLMATFQLARSRAISQVKPSDIQVCNGVLRGYEVKINVVSRSYDLNVACGDETTPTKKNIIPTKILPNNISFIATQNSFFFPILTGNVVGSGVVSVTGYGRTKSISVDTVGGITIK